MQRCLTQYQLKYKVQEDLTDHMKDRKLASGGSGHQAGNWKKQTYKSALIYSFIYAFIQNTFVEHLGAQTHF